MSLQTFPSSIQPLNNFRVSRKPNVNVVKFGDGFEQRLSEGLQTNPVIFNGTFNLNASDSNTVMQFLDARITNNESFNFLIPNETSTRIFVCFDYPIQSPYNGRNIIRVTFREVFE